MAWDGAERRTEERTTIYEQLGELRVRLTHVEDALTDMKEIKNDITDVKNLLQQGKGIAKMLQILFYVVGPLVAAIYWIKEHVR